jgi:hypothetical protein
MLWVSHLAQTDKIDRRNIITIQMRFQVLTAPSMKISVFWDVVPYSLVETDRRFRGAHCLIRAMALIMEEISTSETSVNFYQTTWRNILEDSNLQYKRHCHGPDDGGSKHLRNVSQFVPDYTLKHPNINDMKKYFGK